eukprot:COSAG02_NODE_3865_length_6124_cov_27.767303_3_plen_119_part_00
MSQNQNQNQIHYSNDTVIPYTTKVFGVLLTPGIRPYARCHSDGLTGWDSSEVLTPSAAVPHPVLCQPKTPFIHITNHETDLTGAHLAGELVSCSALSTVKVSEWRALQRVGPGCAPCH